MNRRNYPKSPCTVTKLDPEGAVLSVVTVETRTYERRASRGEGTNSRKSSRTMTDEDARRVMFGDLKDLSHGKAAKALELSYGQVYSARGGYTFKHIQGE